MKRRLITLAAMTMICSAFAGRDPFATALMIEPLTLKSESSFVFSPFEFELDAAILSEGMDTISRATIAETLGVLTGYDNAYFDKIEVFKSGWTNAVSICDAKGFFTPDYALFASDYRVNMQKHFGVEVCSLRHDLRRAERWFKAKLDGKAEDFQIDGRVARANQISYYDVLCLEFDLGELARGARYSRLEFARPDRTTALLDALEYEATLGIWEDPDFTLVSQNLCEATRLIVIAPPADGDFATFREKIFFNKRLMNILRGYGSLANIKYQKIRARLTLPFLNLKSVSDLKDVFAHCKMPLKYFESIKSEHSLDCVEQQVRCKFVLGHDAAKRKEEGAPHPTADLKSICLNRPFFFFVYHEPTEALVAAGQFTGK